MPCTVVLVLRCYCCRADEGFAKAFDGRITFCFCTVALLFAFYCCTGTRGFFQGTLSGEGILFFCCYCRRGCQGNLIVISRIRHSSFQSTFSVLFIHFQFLFSLDCETLRIITFCCSDLQRQIFNKNFLLEDFVRRGNERFIKLSSELLLLISRNYVSDGSIKFTGNYWILLIAVIKNQSVNKIRYVLYTIARAIKYYTKLNRFLNFSFIHKSSGTLILCYND